MEDESSQDAEEHLRLTDFMLSLYGKTIQNVVARIGNNCSTNKAFARLMSTDFIVCASHRLNLAKKDVLKNHEFVISKVRKQMQKIRNLMIMEKLRILPDMKPWKGNATRCSSIFAILSRFKE